MSNREPRVSALYLLQHHQEYLECANESADTVENILRDEGYAVLFFNYAKSFATESGSRDEDAMFVCFKGRLTVHCEDQSFELVLGDCVTIPASTVFSLSSTDSCQYFFCR